MYVLRPVLSLGRIALGIRPPRSQIREQSRRLSAEPHFLDGGITASREGGRKLWGK